MTRGPKVKIYTAVRMTGRRMDEVRVESDMLVRTVENYGFVCLNPVLEEHIPYSAEKTENTPHDLLLKYWKRDKEMIRGADLVLDFNTGNLSDGANKEIGYARYCLWKPVVRVVTGKGFLISRIEDDYVVESLSDALDLIREHFGSYAKLGAWRSEVMDRSFQKWMSYQQSMEARYALYK